MKAAKAIKVSRETYDHLDAQARVRGMSIEKFLEIVLREFDQAKERAFIDSLRAEGLIVTFPQSDLKMPRNFKPVPVKGKPVSQTIIEDREPR